MRAARGLTSKEHDSKSFNCAVCRITILEKQCFHFPLNHFQAFPDIAFLAQAYPPILLSTGGEYVNAGKQRYRANHQKQKDVTESGFVFSNPLWSRLATPVPDQAGQ